MAGEQPDVEQHHEQLSGGLALPSQLVTEQASAKRVHHLKSPAEMTKFLQAVQQETTRQSR